MVKAILQGRKTQTRRMSGLEARNENPGLWTREGARTTKMYKSFEDFDNKINWCPFFEFIKTTGQAENESHYTRPRYNIGDLLWVRETFHVHGKSENGVPTCVSFKAQAVDPKDKGWTWKPSIHMPKEAARIWLMVEDIRVERVKNISDTDAKAEGIESAFIDLFKETRYRCYSSKNKISYHGFPRHWASNWREAKSSFQSLWISINGEESWNANPWVWVIQFRALSTTGKPSDEVIQANYKEVRNG